MTYLMDYGKSAKAKKFKGRIYAPGSLIHLIR
jgi:hypothetical protein